MTTWFLAVIGGQLFAFERDRVAGVGARGRRHSGWPTTGGQLPLAGGRQALVCDLLALPGMASAGRDGLDHLLVIMVDHLWLALAMSGRGRLATFDETAWQPLPPAFRGAARHLVTGVLPNGADLVLRIDPQALRAWSETAAGSGVA